MPVPLCRGMLHAPLLITVPWWKYLKEITVHTSHVFILESEETPTKYQTKTWVMFKYVFKFSSIVTAESLTMQLNHGSTLACKPMHIINCYDTKWNQSIACMGGVFCVYAYYQSKQFSGVTSLKIQSEALRWIHFHEYFIHYQIRLLLQKKYPENLIPKSIFAGNECFRWTHLFNKLFIQYAAIIKMIRNMYTCIYLFGMYSM